MTTVYNTKPKKTFFDISDEELLKNDVDDTFTEKDRNDYKILWYNPPHYIQVREDAKYVGFSNCEYSNCKMSFNKRDRLKSDAIILDGRFVQGYGPRDRPVGQVWIFAAHESPIEYNGPTDGKWKEAPWKNSYNWTMTYNKLHTDIYLPYGVLKKKQGYNRRNYEMISSMKKNEGLIITSHCETQSNRTEYINELRKHFPITVLGKCGEKWNCGRAHVHDDCFNLLNTTFKYYLAFENALCQQYFTEKLFDNYKYDTVLITRGGSEGEADKLFPEGTFISADNFKSAEGLAEFLNDLSNSDYAAMLEKKDMYYSPGYKTVYETAMCDLCEKMNNQDAYRKTIPDIEKWAFGENQCRKPNDVPLKTF